MTRLPTAPVRVAVVGAGEMGRNHLRVYDMLKDVELAGVLDADPSVSESMARRYGCRAFQSLDEVIDGVDAASICAPSSTHGEIGRRLLAAGVHCLVEKPLATSEEECLTLIEAARASGAKLLVGHIERFNPAVQQLSLLLSTDQAIRAIDARRLSSVSRRITDVDVVADLMVHDLDIVTALMGSRVSSISAAAVGTSGSSRGDHVTALLRFENRAMACLTASRITQNTVRKLSVTTDAGLIEVDYMNQSVEVYLQDKVKITEGRAARFGDYALDIAMERVLVRRTEPLQVELSHFIDIILADGAPMVTGEQGLEAFRLVEAIQDSIRKAEDVAP